MERNVIFYRFPNYHVYDLKMVRCTVSSSKLRLLDRLVEIEFIGQVTSDL